MQSYTVIADNERPLYTGGDLEEAVARAHAACAAGSSQYVVIFDDATGERTEVDPAQDLAAVQLRLGLEPTRQGPGRPKLGVVSREVSLLPVHWEWLNAQRGGASAALRKLIDEARAGTARQDAARRARDAAYKVMAVVGGDRPGFEEASRALYANRFDEVAPHLAAWPEGLRAHVVRLVERAREVGA
jgi:hypothetical protein